MGYDKLNSLIYLEQKGLNIHEYEICSTHEEIFNAMKKYEFMCSVRTDSKSNSTDLPFALIDGLNYDIRNIVNKVDGSELIAIVSNGHFYDKSLIYNAVYMVTEDSRFSVELSTKNVPLRHMYEHPKGLINCSGYIDDLKSWNIPFNKNEVNMYSLRADLRALWLYKVYNKYVEVSKYSERCGKMDDYFAFWQVR